MRPLRYYQFIERDTSEISVAWKALHALIFLLIAFSSTLSIYAFCDIFDIFNYNCVLYCTPHFSLERPPDLNGTDHTTARIRKRAASMTDFKHFGSGDDTVDEFPVPSENITMPDIATASKVPNTEDMYVHQDRIWHISDKEHATGWVHIVMYKTIFSTPITCDYVILVPLISLLTSAVFASVVTVCGKGGKGYESDAIPGAWIVVYPIVVASVFMLILNMHTSDTVHKGLYSFCFHFRKYTGSHQCNEYMNYFTVQQMLGYRNYYQSYLICFYTYTITVILWLSQLLIALLRIIVFTDFDFTSILVRKRNQEITSAAEEVWETSQSAKLANMVNMLKKAEQEKKSNNSTKK